MHHYDRHTHGSGEPRPAGNTLHDRATTRMLAAMGGHEWLRPRPALFTKAQSPRRPGRFAEPARESDRAYFRRRSREERRAAGAAASAAARQAHEGLADLHARRSEFGTTCVVPAPSGRAKRQDALLDEALKQTFPASDPVGVFRVE